MWKLPNKEFLRHFSEDIVLLALLLPPGALQGPRGPHHGAPYEPVPRSPWATQRATPAPPEPVLSSSQAARLLGFGLPASGSRLGF